MKKVFKFLSVWSMIGLMNSSQVNYPEKLVILGRKEKVSLSLNKGPQRREIALENYEVELLRNDRAIQPIIIPQEDGFIHSLTLTIPLTESWTPLIYKKQNQAYTTFLLRNEKAPTVLQIYQNPKNPGLVKYSLRGKKLSIQWFIDKTVMRSERITLSSVHYKKQENQVEPARFTLKESLPGTLNKGRFFSFPKNPSPQNILDDVKNLSDKGLSFNFYLLDYGISPLWGDWTTISNLMKSKLPLVLGAIRNTGALPGIRLSPLTAGKKSQIYKEGELLLKKASPLPGVDEMGGAYPLDITKEGVMKHFVETLEFYIQMGFKFFHLDNLDALWAVGEWEDSSKGPTRRFHLLTALLEGYKKRGIRFSTNTLPIQGGLEIFDFITAPLSQKKGLSQKGWDDYSDLLALAITIKNPPLLSMGGLILTQSKSKKENRQRDIISHSQSLLNGPAILADPAEDMTEREISQWGRLSQPKKKVLPLEISDVGLSQNVLLLVNRKQRFALLNLTKSTKIILIKEGEFGDSRGLSPSQTTALKSQELILKMKRESSYVFQV